MMNFNTGETLWEIGNTPSKARRRAPFTFDGGHFYFMDGGHFY
jgi:hypothetical protein